MVAARVCVGPTAALTSIADVWWKNTVDMFWVALTVKI
jgi:hypothetical protein